MSDTVLPPPAPSKPQGHEHAPAAAARRGEDPQLEAAVLNVDDIDGLREGQLDPVLNVVIGELVYHESDFIVYLDDKLRVQYRGEFAFPAGSEEITFDLARLESLTYGQKVDGQVRIMRRLVAEVIAHLHGAPDLVRAQACLTKADAIITGIVADCVRIRRIWSATAVTCIAGLLGWGWIACHQSTSSHGITPDNEFGLWLPLGAVGALLSSSRRMSTVTVKPFTSRALAYWESVARILAGAIGALLLVSATKSNLLLGVLAESTNGANAFWGLMTISLLAGASERLVPDFIDRMDSSAAGGAGASGGGAGAGGAGGDQ